MSETPIRAVIEVRGTFDPERFAERLGVERWYTFTESCRGKCDQTVWATEIAFETDTLSFVVRPLLHRIDTARWRQAQAAIRASRCALVIELDSCQHESCGRETAAVNGRLPRLELDADLMERAAVLGLDVEYDVRVPEA